MRGQVLAHLQTDCDKVVQKCPMCQKVFHRDEWAKHLDESKECGAAANGRDFLSAGACSCHQNLRQLEVKLQARLDALERWQLAASGQRRMGSVQSSQTGDGETGGRVGDGGVGDGNGESASGTDDLARLLRGAGLGSIASRLCEEIGLVEVSDLGLLHFEDVQADWLKPVQRRKLLALGDRVRQQERVQQRPKYLHSRGSSSSSANVEDANEGVFQNDERSAIGGSCGSGTGSPASCLSGKTNAPERAEGCVHDKEQDSDAEGLCGIQGKHGLGGAGSGAAAGAKRKRAT